MHAPVRPLSWQAACAAALLAVAPHAFGQAAGEVEFSRGVGFAQSDGQAPRTLGKGLPLREGDRLTTSEGASAVIKLQDGTRMTLRPNSELVVQQYQFKDNAPDNSMLMQLVRGGFRAVTGAISKGSPNAARVQTNTATIGIRGTDFDARVCTRDCGAESARIPDAARPNTVQASAKVVTSQGEIYAVNANSERRRLVDGGSIYPGDTLETARASQAVLAFRDDSKITLGAQTRFRVDNFVYDEKNAGDGRFLASILRGSVRALTGIIAKANNKNVGFSTSTATIGIRGTGFDVDFDDITMDTRLYAWLGSIAVQPVGGGGNTQTALEVLQTGQGLFIPRNGPMQSITIEPPNPNPRPDLIPVNSRQLFSNDNVSDAAEGLFVYVRDGHIELVSAREILHLGNGEAGFAGVNGETGRPLNVPKFIQYDQLPMPTSKNPLLASILGEQGIKSDKQCK